MISTVLALTLATASLGRHRERAWTIDDGLPQTSVTSIDQDRGGWLHLGTFGGLARFDGVRVDIPGATDGVGWSSVRITALLVDDDGTRWLGLQSGHVVRIDPDGHDEELVREPTLIGKPIWALRRSDDALWVAGSGGVARWEGAWTAIEAAGPTRALEHHGGRLWLGGVFGLQYVEGTTALTFVEPVGELYSLATRRDDLLMAGDLGVTAKDPAGELRTLDAEPSHDLAVAADGTIYVASGSRVRIAGKPGAHRLGSRVRDLFVGREGVLWVGTDGHGLVRLLREDWSLVDVDGGALPVLEAEDGTLMVGYGCDPGGMVRVGADGELTGFTGGCVRALAWQEGELVMGVDDTVARLEADGSTTTIVDLDHQVLVVRPSGDALWIGTETDGAFRFEHGQLERVEVGDRRVLAIETGVAGEMWFGTQDGLTRIDGRGATRWTRADGVPTGEIRTLRVDADGTVLLGSYGGGLGIFRNGGFRRLTTAHGLADNVISAILDDGRGALWLHGNRGLTRLMRADLGAWLADPRRSVTVRRWATPEGNGGGQPAGIVMRDGSLALPTIEGVVRIDPGQLYDIAVAPTLSVIRTEIDGLALQPNLVLDVPAGPGQVEIEFTAAILRHPELAAFEYRVISDRDDDTAETQWLRAGKDRRLRWAGFRPGRHRIELRVANESGVFSPVTTLRFALAAPWHERWTVRAGLVLAALGLLGGAWTWRSRVARAHLLGLQREIDQRLVAEAETRALAGRLEDAERLEAVGRLAGGVAHDFNNLFAAIRGAAGMLEAEAAFNGAETDAALVRTLEACVDRGARLTGQLLAFARRQQLDAAVLDPDARIAAIEGVLRASMPPGVALRVVASAEPLHVLADGTALDLALVSLALNARDAVPGGGTVTIRAFGLDDAVARARWPALPAAAHGWVVLEVVDDGVGIPGERLARVFEPFYSTRSNSTGLGLPSVLGFAMQSGGTLQLASREGEGTCATLVLPRVTGPSSAPVIASPVPAMTSPAGASVGALRVVVVDDDDLVRSTLVMILRRAGHEPIAFADPTAALAELLGGVQCDLLISDILMPGLTGRELAARVLAARPGLPVLFISGFLRDVEAGTLPGVLLAKPFGRNEVLAAVDAAMQRATADAVGVT